MADYKVIHRAEGAEIPWEPGCPVALTAMQVSRNTETSECWLQAKARNVSGADASSIYAVARLEYADGTSEELPVEYLDADVAAGSEQSLKPRRLPRGDVRSCELVVTRVEVQGEIWESVGAASPLPAREKLALPARAAEQRAINLGIGPGDPAAGGKVRDHGGWWACACGQVNVRRESCCSCGCRKSLLTANEDEAALLADADKRCEAVLAEAKKLQDQGSIPSLTAAIEKYDSLGDYGEANEFAAQCNEKLSELKEIQTTRRKTITRRALIGCAGLAAAAGGVTLFTNVIEPAQKRRRAGEAIAAGNFEEAEALYLEIGDDDGYNQALNLQSEAEGDAALAGGDYATAVDMYVSAGRDDKANEARYAYVSENRNATDELTFTYLCALKESAYEDSATIYDELYAWRFDFAIVIDTMSNIEPLAKFDGEHTLAGKWLGVWPDSDVESWERDVSSGATEKEVVLLVKATSGPPDGSKCTLRYSRRQRYGGHNFAGIAEDKAGDWCESAWDLPDFITADGAPYFILATRDHLYDAVAVAVESEDGTRLFEKTLEAR